jgi:phosphatidylethanolamine/phosphatidyl-N-methylethanolamine N-methyltransferase
MNEKSNTTAQSRSAWRFVEAFIREPLKVGALWPSSSGLSKLIVDSCDFAPGDAVVELGPGTGSFTGLLLEKLRGRGRMLAMELSETNIAELRQRYPHCETIHDSAENLPKHLNGARAKCIVSGLAWGNMFPAMQDRIFNAMIESLAPEGQFVAFAYVHARFYPTTIRFRKLMFSRFKRVELTPIIWRNLPPAYVYRCWKR